MILLRLFYEFFKTGLFAVGGGLATIPFLQNMGAETGWFTDHDLTTMIAISESTPGPMGVNMATYVGFHISGIAGAVVATLGLITPSIIVILIIAGFLERFRDSKLVDSAFRGLRPASTALIAVAGLSVAVKVFLRDGGGDGAAGIVGAVDLRLVILSAAVFVMARYVKYTKKLHPICFIGLSALVGIVFKLGGA